MEIELCAFYFHVIFSFSNIEYWNPSKVYKEKNISKILFQSQNII
jgi:hypothetical protein